MRAVFFLLLLANGVFYAWTHGLLGSADTGREPMRINSQLAADRLEFVPVPVVNIPPVPPPPAVLPPPETAGPAAVSAMAPPAPPLPELSHPAFPMELECT